MVMKRIALRNPALVLVVLITASGMLLGLVSYFLPWYIICFPSWPEPLFGLWYLTGPELDLFGWGGGLSYLALKGLYPRGIFIGGLIGLAAVGSLAYLHRHSPTLLLRSVTPLIVLLLPWIGTTSLYVLCGYDAAVPGGGAYIDFAPVPVAAIGFYANLLASVLLLLALSVSLAGSRFKEGARNESLRGLLARGPLLVMAVVMAASAYLPWYLDQPNRYTPEFLLPLTLGISFNAVVIYTLEYEEHPIVPLLMLVGGLLLLLRPQDPDVLTSFYLYGMPPALSVLQVSALFWVVVGILWLLQFIPLQRHVDGRT